MPAYELVIAVIALSTCLSLADFFCGNAEGKS